MRGKMRYIGYIIICLGIGIPAQLFASNTAQALISRATAGESNNNSSSFTFGDLPDISDDGRYIVFSSAADNLVPGDTNGFSDIFLYDQLAVGGSLTLISKSTLGLPSDGHSYEPVISGDGTVIAFTSFATNLVTLDTNLVSDVFLYTIATGATTRVSVSTTNIESEAPSNRPSISTNGDRVAFISDAVSITVGDTNSSRDAFLRTISTGTTARVSLDGAGTQILGDTTDVKISGNGQYVFFVSENDSIVAGDTNTANDIFRKTVATGAVIRVSVNTVGVEGDESSSRMDVDYTGDIVVFESGATTYVPGSGAVNNIFLKNIATNTISRISSSGSATEPNGNSYFGKISRDGSTVMFLSQATDIIAGDTNGVIDTFVHKPATGITERVSTYLAGQIDDDTYVGSLSSDGTYITFTTRGTNALAAASSNGFFDVYSNRAVVTAPTVTSSTSSSGFVNYTCRDITAINYSSRGRHRASLCKYTNRPTPTVSATTKTCPIFTQYMRKGDRDGSLAQSKQAKGISTTITEVRLLQRTLKEQGFFTGTPNGVFGPQTEKAVRAWQQTHREFVLDPWGYLKGPTGWFYQSSERWMNELLGCEDTVTLDTGTRLDVRYRDRL
jgi:hypothetical protein